MLSKDYVDESEERILNDDYKNWKKSVSFLYDMVMTHALHWPSFTFEWLPGVIENDTVVKSRILLGSTTDSDRSHILLADVVLPSEDDLDPDTRFGTYKASLGRIELQKRIIHHNAVTRARHMPQKPDIIATTSTNAINIYDTDNKSYAITDGDSEDFASIPESLSKPALQLTGFSKYNGIISWNRLDGGMILGAGDQHSIGLWDLYSHGSDSNLPASTVFSGHTGGVTDVSWWPSLQTVFLSSSLDCTIGLWDTRSRTHSRPSHSITGHKQPITSVAASPFSQFIFASTSEDSSLALWDVRNLSLKLHSLTNRPNDPMHAARWSPHCPNLIANATASRTVCIWDLDVLHDADKMQSERSDKNDPPELVFMHGGHSAAIGDLGWHPEARNVIGSSGNDNIIQIWKPIENLLATTIAQPMPSQIDDVNNQTLTTALESEDVGQ